MESTSSPSATSNNIPKKPSLAENITEMFVAPYRALMEQHNEMVDMCSSNSQKVAEFTQETGYIVPSIPRPMTKEEVRFLIRMGISEYLEMAQTVTDDPISFVRECFESTDKPKPITFDINDPIARMAAQVDAAVDVDYYTENAFTKVGINKSRCFDLVHDANMAKRFPDRTFHRREDDGKIIKPDGWKEPDMYGEICRQRGNGNDLLPRDENIVE